MTDSQPDLAHDVPGELSQLVHRRLIGFLGPVSRLGEGEAHRPIARVIRRLSAGAAGG
jgi:hypothetical protein